MLPPHQDNMQHFPFLGHSKMSFIIFTTVLGGTFNFSWGSSCCIDFDAILSRYVYIDESFESPF